MYAEMVSGALQVLTQELVFNYRTAGTYTPSTGAVGGDFQFLDLPLTIRGVLVKSTSELVDDSTIESGDMVIEVPVHDLASGVEQFFRTTAIPLHVTHNGRRKVVVGFNERVVGDETVAYQFRVRG